ncbi:MAG: S41 family peptidase [Marinifilaceae bacterium]
MRYPTISPDGTTVAFSYKGNIYTVPTAGGEAKLLTSHPAYDNYPVWSPDSKTIAFGSARQGGMDIYTVSAVGGTPKQVTFHSGNEVPVTFTPDGKRIVFKANIMPSKDFSEFPRQGQVYSIPVEGGRQEQFLTFDASSISFSKDGNRIVYYDNKGYEDQWRKHHKSSVCRDVWMYDAKADKYTNITNGEVEDRDPIFTNNDNDIYFLSERFGTFNICKLPLNNPTNITQVTSHTTHPVRFLSQSNNNVLCYAYDGELYTLKEGKQPQKINVTLTADELEREVEYHNWSNGASAIALSPNGNEIAFVLRGDVFVTSTEYNTTNRITNTPQQERNVSFSPDGRSLIYSGERDGQWQIYQMTLDNDDDKLFTYAKKMSEKQLTKGMAPHFQPAYAPNGKEIAYLKNRTELVVMDLKSGKERTVLPAEYNYSYADGDQTYEWSPNSEWILVKFFEKGGWQNNDVAMVKADGSGEIHNLTRSGYSDQAPTWAMNGEAILWVSDRNGYRSHGSWGSQFDVFGMFLTDEAWDKFRLNKEDLHLQKENEGRKDKGEEEGETKAEKKEAKRRLSNIDFETARDRKVRLTFNPTYIGAKVLTPDAERLLYITGSDLWVRNLKDGSTRVLAPGVGGGSLQLSKDGNTVYLLHGGGIRKINVHNGQGNNKGFNAPFELKRKDERAYILSHAWQQVTDKFYDPEIHGIDWEGYKNAYARFLPHINNNYDFADLLGEMLGELNASHTGARYSAPGGESNTRAFGAFYDETYKGDGLKIAEVLKKGPLSVPGLDIEAGDIITHINGEEIKAGDDVHKMLSHLPNNKVTITVCNKNGRKARELSVNTMSAGQESGMLYDRWVLKRKELVEKLSDGQIGYVHIRGMDSPSFRTVFSELLGEYRNKKAVVVDTRSNGGGWLHDDLVTLLSGKKYADFMPRGQFIGQDPLFKWTKPSAVIMSENNYSNAHGFPWAYRQNNIGKLVGTPVPGTMTAVWWENQIDQSIVFGIPQLGIKDKDGNYLENLQLEPDVKVYNTPNETVKGNDPQLEATVKLLLEEIK